MICVGQVYVLIVAALRICVKFEECLQRASQDTHHVTHLIVDHISVVQDTSAALFVSVRQLKNRWLTLDLAKGQEIRRALTSRFREEDCSFISVEAAVIGRTEDSDALRFQRFLVQQVLLVPVLLDFVAPD